MYNQNHSYNSTNIYNVIDYNKNYSFDIEYKFMKKKMIVI